MKKAAAAVGMATFYNVSLALPPKTKVFVAIGHFTAPSSNIIDWVTVQHDCPARRVEARYSKDILTLYFNHSIVGGTSLFITSARPLAKELL